MANRVSSFKSFICFSKIIMFSKRLGSRHIQWGGKTLRARFKMHVAFTQTALRFDFYTKPSPSICRWRV